MIILTFKEFSKQYNIEIPSQYSCVGLKEISNLVGCPCIYYLNTFVEKSNPAQEKDDLCRQMQGDILIYSYLWNKSHLKYSYYEILFCKSKDIKDIIKAFKAMKLKAFL